MLQAMSGCTNQGTADHVPEQVTEALCHNGFLQQQPSAVPGTHSVVTGLVLLLSQLLLQELALVLHAVLMLQGHCWALAAGVLQLE